MNDEPEVQDNPTLSEDTTLSGTSIAGNPPDENPTQEAAETGSGDSEGFTLDNLTAAHLPPDFDPATHAVNPDGTPKRNADGSLAKKRGRKPLQAGETPPGSVSTKPITRKPTVDTSGVTAMAIVSAIETIATNMVGEEWVMADHEKNMQTDAWATYLKANNLQDLPPGIALCFVTLVYAAPRFKNPNTKSKFKAIFGGLVPRVKWAFGKALHLMGVK
jgi:hypothetical protein